MRKALLCLLIGTVVAHGQNNLDGTAGAANTTTSITDKPRPYQELSAIILRALPLTPMEQPTLPGGVNIHFNVPGFDSKIEDYVVKMINAAKTEILFSQYCVTSQRIADALVAARERKCTVVGILETRPHGVEDYNAPDYFLENNVAVFYSTAAGVNNNKFCIIDRKIVMTGSYDWTKGSNTANAENLITIEDPGIMVAYYNAFITQLSSSLVPKRMQQLLESATGLTLPAPAQATQPAPPNPSQ